MSDRLSADQWGQFWQSGSITTFTGRFGANYDGEITRFWHELFSELPNAAGVVDVGAGNGALSLLAQQYSDANGKSFAVTAVDYADVNPLAYEMAQSLTNEQKVLLKKIRFLGGTLLEDTGLPDAQFDAIVSQFGFEYADVKRGVAEVARLLKPQRAVFAAIMHHPESAILAQAKSGIRQARLCLKSDVTETVRQLLNRMGQLQTDRKDPARDPLCESLRATLNKKTGHLVDAQSKFEDPSQIGFYVSNCMAPFGPEFRSRSNTDKLQAIMSTQLETEAYLSRMQDLISTAATKPRVNEIVRALKGYGFEAVDVAEFEFENVLFAQTLIARR